jgi:hypothetical protein
MPFIIEFTHGITANNLSVRVISIFPTAFSQKTLDHHLKKMTAGKAAKERDGGPLQFLS